MPLPRAISVGGNNTLAMKDLASVFVGAGCVDVETQGLRAQRNFADDERGFARCSSGDARITSSFTVE